MRPQTKRPRRDLRAPLWPPDPAPAAFLTEMPSLSPSPVEILTRAALPENFFCVVVPGIDRECAGWELQGDDV